MNEITEALRHLQKALVDNEMHYFTLRDVIATNFVDQAKWDERTWNKEELHVTAVKSADYFLRIVLTNLTKT